MDRADDIHSLVFDLLVVLAMLAGTFVLAAMVLP
jgi:hypothetical protein